MGNKHKKFGEDRMYSSEDMIADRHTHTHTHTYTHTLITILCSPIGSGLIHNLNEVSKRTDFSETANQSLAEYVELFDPLVDARFDWSDMARTCDCLNVNVAFVQIDLHSTHHGVILVHDNYNYNRQYDNQQPFYCHYASHTKCLQCYLMSR